MRKTTVQHIAGYFLGGLVFLFAIPLGMVGLSKALDPLLNVPLIPYPVLRLVLSIVLLLCGLLFAFWSLIIQNTVGQGGPLEFANVEISPRTKKLVVTGPYRYTRNPMLFGACSLYFAVALYLNSISALSLAILFMVFMLFFVKRVEEKRLLREFGAEYEEYRQKVSMFIPWPMRKSAGKK